MALKTYFDKDADLARLVPEVEGKLGPIDVFVHSAGIFAGELVEDVTVELSPSHTTEVMLDSGVLDIHKKASPLPATFSTIAAP